MEYVHKCKVHKGDTALSYSRICAELGAAPCGLQILHKLMHNKSSDTLEMKGLGMTQSAARALFLAIRGIAPCGLCKGLGYLNPGVFDASSVPHAIRKTPQEVRMCASL